MKANHHSLTFGTNHVIGFMVRFCIVNTWEHGKIAWIHHIFIHIRLRCGGVNGFNELIRKCSWTHSWITHQMNNIATKLFSFAAYFLKIELAVDVTLFGLLSISFTNITHPSVLLSECLKWLWRMWMNGAAISLHNTTYSPHCNQTMSKWRKCQHFISFRPCMVISFRRDVKACAVQCEDRLIKTRAQWQKMYTKFNASSAAYEQKSRGKSH